MGGARLVGSEQSVVVTTFSVVTVCSSVVTKWIRGVVVIYCGAYEKEKASIFCIVVELVPHLTNVHVVVMWRKVKIIGF